MVVVAQLVRAPDCGSGGRGFESHLPPKKERSLSPFFYGVLISSRKILFKRIAGLNPGRYFSF